VGSVTAKEEVMQRFKNILVVIDDGVENGGVVQRAVTLAQRNHARLTVANAVKELPRLAPVPEIPERVVGMDIIEEWPPGADRPPAPEPPVVPSGGPQGGPIPAVEPALETAVEPAVEPVAEPAVVIREQIVEEESQLLEKWVDFVRQRGVPVGSKILYGTPFLEIIREVLRSEHDLVMTTAVGRGVLRERLFGSTTMHLMRKCPCPVWVMVPSQPVEHTRILAAVNPAPQDEEEHGVNTKIMDMATALAQRQQCELAVVHAWSFPVERSLRSGYNVASSELDNWVQQARDLHRRRLADFLRPYNLEELQAQVYMLKGEAGQLIPELATKLEVGLIVMGTLSHSGVAGLLIGSTAERILRRVDCSVLTVKPDGFVTPVRLDE
jgi:nucleotide-binding universal stress UspA family protein